MRGLQSLGRLCAGPERQRATVHSPAQIITVTLKANWPAQGDGRWGSRASTP
jgi:hypothetical protein